MSAIDSFCFSRASRNLSPADAGNSDASSRGVSVIRFSGGRDATLFFSRLDARCFKAGACCQRLVRDRGVVCALARAYVLIHEFDSQGGRSEEHTSELQSIMLNEYVRIYLQKSKYT